MGNVLTKMATRTVGRTVKNAAKTAAVGAATVAGTNLMAKAFGIDDTLFGKVVTAGVPMMVMGGHKDKGVAGNLFAGSKKKDRKRPKDADEAEREFFNVFGKSAGTITKAVSEETGATEKQVGGILGSLIPDVEEVIAEEAPADEKGLMDLFGREAEDAKRQTPSLGRMMAKALF